MPKVFTLQIKDIPPIGHILFIILYFLQKDKGFVISRKADSMQRPKLAAVTETRSNQRFPHQSVPFLFFTIIHFLPKTAITFYAYFPSKGWRLWLYKLDRKCYYICDKK